MPKQIIFEKDCLLERFQAKGGWTFVLFPELIPENRIPFGMRKVSGQIDDFFFEDMTLMPFGKGILFLPIRAEIRKEIGKEAGDKVHVKLMVEKVEESDEDLMNCLRDAPLAFERFMQLPIEERNMHIQSVQGIQWQDKKVEKIVKLIEKLERNL